MTECDYRQSCEFIKRYFSCRKTRRRDKILFETYCNGPGMDRCAIKDHAAESGRFPENLLPSGKTAREFNEVLILAFVGVAVVALAWIGVLLLD